MDENKTNISETDMPKDQSLAGVPEGVVEKTDENVPVEVRARIENEERVVYDRNENGEVIGWHKEPVGSNE